MPSLDITEKDGDESNAKTKQQRMLTISEEDGKKVKVFWIVDIAKVVCTGLPERCSVEYPPLANKLQWMMVSASVDTTEGMSDKCELAQKSVAMSSCE